MLVVSYKDILSEDLVSNIFTKDILSEDLVSNIFTKDILSEEMVSKFLSNIFFLKIWSANVLQRYSI